MKKILSMILALAMLLSMAVTATAEEITDYRTYQTAANEMETFNIHYSQGAVDLNVLTNCIDGLLTNDNYGNLIANAAKSWTSEDGGQTWTFVLNEGMQWADYQGNPKAEVVAEDWLWGLEWVLNFAKNGARNITMPGEMIVGANDYYEYTKKVAEEQGEEAAKNLGLEKFLEMVGISCPDKYTIVYKCTDKLSYFPTVATYNCLYPLSGALLQEIGVDGYMAATFDTIWYSGPYTLTSYLHGSEKIFTANPIYWNKDNVKTFNTVTVKMVDSAEVAFQLFQTGELDYVALSQSNLSTIYGSESNEWHDYLVEARPTKYSYQIHLVYDKKLADGSPDVNWNTAVANEAFRKSLYYGLDATDYLARTNAINPLSCQNYCYTANGVATTSDGTDYTQLVRNELGLQYDYTTYSRVNPELAAQYKAQAIEELTAKGVTFPIVIDYYIAGGNQNAKDTADVLAQIISDCLGDDYVQLNICTYVSSLSNEVRKPQLASMYINGWGADFGDPINFLGQETYGEDGAYYSTAYSMCNNNTDPDLIACYTEFTRLTNEAKAITDDLDARYAAFAKAEAYMIEKALVIPWNYDVSWQLTGVNDYSKIYTAYGIQAERYVNWETQFELYTTDDYAALKDAYNAQ